MLHISSNEPDPMDRTHFLRTLACTPALAHPGLLNGSPRDQSATSTTPSDTTGIDPLPQPGRILLEAHRGNSMHAPENTLAAIEQALEIGVDRVEVDLMVSADRELVVIHDATVDRTTDGSGAVAGMEFSRLRRLDAGSWKDPKYRGEKIPTLEEVFDLCRNRAMVNIDLKSLDAVEPLIRLVKEWDFEDHLVITGKVPRSVPMFRDAGLHLTMFWEQGTLFGRYLEEGKYPEAISTAVQSARKHSLPGFLFHSRWIGPEIVKAAHLHGLAVNVYSVEDRETLERMAAAHVDGVMTDDPMLIKNYLIGG